MEHCRADAVKLLEFAQGVISAKTKKYMHDECLERALMENKLRYERRLKDENMLNAQKNAYHKIQNHMYLDGMKDYQDIAEFEFEYEARNRNYNGTMSDNIQPITYNEWLETMKTFVKSIPKHEKYVVANKVSENTVNDKNRGIGEYNSSELTTSPDESAHQTNIIPKCEPLEIKQDTSSEIRIQSESNNNANNEDTKQIEIFDHETIAKGSFDIKKYPNYEELIMGLEPVLLDTRAVYEIIDELHEKGKSFSLKDIEKITDSLQHSKRTLSSRTFHDSIQFLQDFNKSNYTNEEYLIDTQVYIDIYNAKDALLTSINGAENYAKEIYETLRNNSKNNATSQESIEISLPTSDETSSGNNIRLAEGETLENIKPIEKEPKEEEYSISKRPKISQRADKKASLSQELDITINPSTDESSVETSNTTSNTNTKVNYANEGVDKDKMSGFNVKNNDTTSDTRTKVSNANERDNKDKISDIKTKSSNQETDQLSNEKKDELSDENGEQMSNNADNGVDKEVTNRFISDTNEPKKTITKKRKSDTRYNNDGCSRSKKIRSTFVPNQKELLENIQNNQKTLEILLGDNTDPAFPKVPTYDEFRKYAPPDPNGFAKEVIELIDNSSSTATPISAQSIVAANQNQIKNNTVVKDSNTKLTVSNIIEQIEITQEENKDNMLKDEKANTSDSYNTNEEKHQVVEINSSKNANMSKTNDHAIPTNEIKLLPGNDENVRNLCSSEKITAEDGTENNGMKKLLTSAKGDEEGNVDEINNKHHESNPKLNNEVITTKIVEEGAQIEDGKSAEVLGSVKGTMITQAKAPVKNSSEHSNKNEESNSLKDGSITNRIHDDYDEQGNLEEAGETPKKLRNDKCHRNMNSSKLESINNDMELDVGVISKIGTNIIEKGTIPKTFPNDIATNSNNPFIKNHLRRYENTTQDSNSPKPSTSKLLSLHPSFRNGNATLNNLQGNPFLNKPAEVIATKDFNKIEKNETARATSTTAIKTPNGPKSKVPKALRRMNDIVAKYNLDK